MANEWWNKYLLTPEKIKRFAHVRIVRYGDITVSEFECDTDGLCEAQLAKLFSSLPTDEQVREEILKKVKAATPWDNLDCDVCCDYAHNEEKKAICCADGELITTKEKCPTQELTAISLTDNIMSLLSLQVEAAREAGRQEGIDKALSRMELYFVDTVKPDGIVMHHIDDAEWRVKIRQALTGNK